MRATATSHGIGCRRYTSQGRPQANWASLRKCFDSVPSVDLQPIFYAVS